MGDKTKIQWADATWNPFVGCSKVTRGCDNCYALRDSIRFQKAGIKGYEKATIDNRWSGHIEFLRERLDIPARWKKPRKIFVCSMSDLFHDSIPPYAVMEIMRVIRANPRHTFMVLTKRPQNMVHALYLVAKLNDDVPLPNLWAGVSISTQNDADRFLPLLTQCNAALKFVSAEPLLGEIDLSKYDYQNEHGEIVSAVDWIVVGGETGVNARPCPERAVDTLHLYSKLRGVPFFFKQWGEWSPARRDEDGACIMDDANGNTVPVPPFSSGVRMRQSKVDKSIYARVGKNKAGHRLHGVEYLEFPELDLL